MNKDFQKYCISKGIGSLNLHRYNSIQNPKSMTPMIVEESQLNASTISVFDRLMKDKIIFLGTEIDDFIANIINAQLLYLESEGSHNENIQIYINTPGGDVYSGLSIVDTMNLISTDVYTGVMGLAASMGAVISTNGKKGHRYALKNSKIMMHQPLTGIDFAQATDIAIVNKEIQDLKRDLYEILATNTGQSIETIYKDCERDFQMKADEAKKYGAIDDIFTKLKK